MVAWEREVEMEASVVVFSDHPEPWARWLMTTPEFQCLPVPRGGERGGQPSSYLTLLPSLYSIKFLWGNNKLCSEEKEDTEHDSYSRPGYQEQWENFGLKPISLFSHFPPVPWAPVTDDTIILKCVSGENTPAQQLSTSRKTAWQCTECSCSVAESAKHKDIFSFPGTKIGRARRMTRAKYFCWKGTSVDTNILRQNWVAGTSCLCSSGFLSFLYFPIPQYPGNQVTRNLLHPPDTNPVFRKGPYMCLQIEV